MQAKITIFIVCNIVHWNLIISFEGFFVKRRECVNDSTGKKWQIIQKDRRIVILLRLLTYDNTTHTQHSDYNKMIISLVWRKWKETKKNDEEEEMYKRIIREKTHDMMLIHVVIPAAADDDAVSLLPWDLALFFK